MSQIKRIVTILPVIIILVVAIVWLPVPAESAATVHPGENLPLVISPVPASPKPVVARLYFNSADEIELLTRQLDVWEINRSVENTGSLIALLSPDQLVSLQQAGVRLEILPELSARVNQPLVSLPGQTTGIPGYPCYRTVEETQIALDNLVKTYPDLVTRLDYGDSWEKTTPGGNAGYDLWAIVLTNHAIPVPKPRFFLMAAIHARELATAETATRFAEHLLTNYGSDPDITFLLDYSEIHIAPLTNPDGRKKAEAGLLWRKNTDSDDGCSNSTSWGVDLNRNSSFHWNGAGSSSYPCDEVYRGPSAGSEPETQAIQQYVASIFPDQRGSNITDTVPVTATGLFVTLHSYSQLVLWPWGDTSDPAPNTTQLQTLGRKMAYFNHYTPQQASALYPTNGTTDDWTYGELGVASYTIEMGTEFFQSCSDFENTIYPNNRDTLLYAFKASRQPYQTPSGPDSRNLVLSQNIIIDTPTISLTAVADDTRYRNWQGVEPVQGIRAAHYSLDAPSWFTGTITYPMSATDGSFNTSIESINAAIPVEGLSIGRHTLYVESQDTDGNWGVPSAIFFWVQAPVYKFSLTPTQGTVYSDPGQTVTFTLWVSNTGNLSDTYQVSMQGGHWVSSTLPTFGPLDPGDIQALLISVTSPNSASPGTSDVFTVTLTSLSDPTQSSSSRLTTRIARRGVDVQPAASSQTAAPGDPVTHTLTITNTGDLLDTFQLNLAASAWPAILSTSAITLPAGRHSTFSLVVSIPPTATFGMSDTVQLEAISQGNPEQNLQAQVTTIAGHRYGLEISPTEAQGRGMWYPNLTIYKIWITNTGEITDTYLAEITGNLWPVVPVSVSYPLEPGYGGILDIQVTPPSAAHGGDSDVAILTITSQGDSRQTKTARLTTIIWSSVYLPLVSSRSTSSK